MRVLLLEDDPDLGEVLRDALEGRGHEVRLTRSVAAANRALTEASFDVAVLDMMLPDGTGELVLQRIVEAELLTEVVVQTGSPDPAVAVRAIKKGAYDYVLKPVLCEELDALILQAAQKVSLRRENLALKTRLERHEPLPGVVTGDPEMKRVIESLGRVATSELPVLILGESGTGKELFARALHQRSRRVSGPFVALNCAALPDHLLESELFGYEKGAFTGAVSRKLGLLEVADRGVLFLDEVGDLTPAVQVKLLRALESKEFLHLGGTRPVRTDIRIVSATNRDLLALGEQGKFRADLYYRLNGVTISLPPLRDRPGDILPLAAHFLGANRVKKTFSSEATRHLQEYAWPGNVRELQMVVLGAAVMAPGDVVEAEDLPSVVQCGRGRAPTDSRSTATPPPSLAATESLKLDDIECAHIKRVLEKVGGHRGRAAKLLGIDVRTLYNKLGSSRPKGLDDAVD